MEPIPQEYKIIYINYAILQIIILYKYDIHSDYSEINYTILFQHMINGV